jgi:N-acetylglutamate synthase
VKARYVVRITPTDVGERVSIRARIPATPGGPTTTDTLGHLRRWSDGVLEVEQRDGAIRTIAEADLLAARKVPPAPPRRPRG